MLGLMQDWPLLCHRVIDHAATYHGDRRVISRSLEGPLHTTNYRNVRARALRVAQRLDKDGIKLGDRVATLAWNTWRHLEAWYGIMGIGAIYHTVNPRLFPEQIVWIVNHAEDRVLFTDLTFVPLLEKLAERAQADRALRRADRRRAHAGDVAARMRCPTRTGSPRSTATSPGRASTRTPPPASATPRARPAIPRACVYSHRSNVLHALMASAARRDGRRARATSVLPVVPMFHANAWGLAFAAPDGRRQAGDARRQARRRLDLRTARRASRSPSPRRCRRCG